MSRAGAIVWLVACAGFAPAPSYAAGAGPEPQVAEVIVTRATRECFTSLIHASGYFVPRRSAVVMFPVSGYRITGVRAKVGDTIKRGDVLAHAALISPPADPSKAPADVPLTSLASGVVLQSTAVEGMLTSVTDKPLFTLAVDGEIEAAVDVPSIHLLELQVGQAARVTMRDGSVLDGRVRRVPAVIDPASQMGSTRLTIDTKSGLELSRFINATIEARRSCGIGVPIAALRRTSTGTAVQVVKDDVIVSRSITLGLGNEIDSEVTSGLAEGDLVVAGAGASRDGDHVTPVFADPQDAR